MLRGAVGIGAAGLTAGMGAAMAAAPAGAATLKNAAAHEGAPDETAAHDAAAAHDEPLVVHVHDASTGVVDLYTGEQHVRFTDHQLAARLARAAR